MRTDGKETKAIVQQTAKEASQATAIMQLMANDASEAKSSSIQLTLTFVHTLTPNAIGSQWRQDLRIWFSSPDPSTNHVIQCGSQHQGTANWFFRCSHFEKWKSTGSLLWIHGKRTSSNISLFPLLTTLAYSGIREKCPLVRSFSCVPFSRDLNCMLALRSSRRS